METSNKAHVVRIVGISGEMLKQVDEQVESRHYDGRSAYILNLIERDLSDSENADSQGASNFDTSDRLSVAPREHSTTQNQRRLNTAADVYAVASRQRQIENLTVLAPGADSRETIYGDRG